MVYKYLLYDTDWYRRKLIVQCLFDQIFLTIMWIYRCLCTYIIRKDVLSFAGNKKCLNIIFKKKRIRLCIRRARKNFKRIIPEKSKSSFADVDMPWQTGRFEFVCNEHIYTYGINVKVVVPACYQAVSSLPQISNCSFASPIRPARTVPEWTPMRISISRLRLVLKFRCQL